MSSLRERVFFAVKHRKIIESFDANGAEHVVTRAVEDGLPGTRPAEVLEVLYELEREGKIAFMRSGKRLRAVLWINPAGIPTSAQLAFMEGPERAAAIHAALTSGKIPEINLETGTSSMSYRHILGTYFPSIPSHSATGRHISSSDSYRHVQRFLGELQEHGYLEKIGGLFVLKVSAEARHEALDRYKKKLQAELVKLSEDLVRKQRQIDEVEAAFDR